MSLTLVVGGAASGKSEFAESLLANSPCTPKTYLATMQPFDDECRARIEKHRLIRAEKGFETAERYTALAGLPLPEGGAVLLECLTNLAANELYGPEGAGSEAEPEILRGIETLCARCGELIVVTGELFSGGRDYAEGTEEYLRLLGRLNIALAERADRVYELVCGCAVCRKGGTENVDF